MREGRGGEGRGGEGGRGGERGEGDDVYGSLNGKLIAIKYTIGNLQYCMAREKN